jgi:hypothetical protein
MLAHLAERLLREPKEVQGRISLRRRDMRSVRLNQRFPLVLCPFNALLHLFSRRHFERFFARVHDHLLPRGLFVFDVSLPNPHELTRDPNRAYHSPRFRHPSADKMVRYTERFDYDHIRQILFVWMEFSPVDQPKRSWATHLAHRQIYPQELEALLHYNGFSVEKLTGDFEGGPLEASSDVMVFRCRARRVSAPIARGVARGSRVP